VRAGLPTGTVTFLFTDIEGSTRLVYEHGDAFAGLLVEHRRLLREGFARHGGLELGTEGDAFFVVFPSAGEAVAAAAEAQAALAGGPVRVRMGLHTGEAQLVEGTYVGLEVHRAARIAAAGHGGQVLVSAATAALLEPGDDQPQGTHLRDLGEHRLKDLLAPERLYQLGVGEFPPLRSLYRANLPVPATPFLGRERELDELTALLARADIRLLTLTGPGGTGKTRLALQAAAELADGYADGVYWVGLASLRDASLVLPTVGQVLGAKEELSEHVEAKRLLLVLDNLEQLTACAPELSSLLAACPNLKLLCTSREPLHVSAEQEYPVPTLREMDAVALFTERALSVRPDFSANGGVTEICRRLDCLPLAIELAAARVKALSPAQILQRLEQRLPLLTGGARDLPERQRTLRSTITWSFELLSGEEQRLFACLSVFVGGCTLDAAEQVCAADLDTLESLVDKSLLRHSNERYWMLETIREYAAERLDETGEAASVQAEHAAYFARLLASIEGVRIEDLEVVALLDAEQGNLRNALARLPEIDPEQAAHVAAIFSWFLIHRKSNLVEARSWLERLLSTEVISGEKQVTLMTQLGHAANLAGDDEFARETLEAALARARSLGSSKLTARVLINLGYFATERERYPEAIEALEEALELAESVQDTHQTWSARSLLSGAYVRVGQIDRGLSLGEACVARWRELGDRGQLVEILLDFGDTLLAVGDLERARSLLEESLLIMADLGPMFFAAEVFEDLAVVAARQGEPERFGRLLGAADRIRAESGAVRMPTWQRRVEAARALAEAEAGRENVQAAWEQGQQLTIEEAVALALGRPLPSPTTL
jgi:predicted ATPase/class 3 adenylate cyclase